MLLMTDYVTQCLELTNYEASAQYYSAYSPTNSTG